MKFVPKEKLSKKAKRELDQARRVTWGCMSPITRRAGNKKAYNRKKSLDRYDEFGRNFFMV